MTYTIADEEPADVARAIIFMYSSHYPDDDTVGCAAEPADVRKLLNAGRKTRIQPTIQQPPSNDNEISTPQLTPRALNMYKLARKLEMKELQAFSLARLGQDIAWKPHLFWVLLESIEMLSDELDPLATFAMKMAKQHVLKLCDDDRFKDLVTTEPVFAYRLVCRVAKNTSDTQRMRRAAPTEPKPIVSFPSGPASTLMPAVNVEQSSLKFGQGMFKAPKSNGWPALFGNTSFGTTSRANAPTFPSDTARFTRSLSSSPTTSDDSDMMFGIKRQKLHDGSHRRISGNCGAKDCS